MITTNPMVESLILSFFRCKNPLCNWIILWFIRNDGWQAVFAGVLAGMIAHLLVLGFWLIFNRRRPALRTSFYMAKLLAWILIPYGVMTWTNFLTFGELNPTYGNTIGMVVTFVVLNALVRIALYCLRYRRFDWVLYETGAILVELYTMTAINRWLLDYVYQYSM